MEHLPLYANGTLIICVAFTAFMLYKATGSITLLITVILWLAIQAAVSLTGFYTVTTALPPRFGIVLVIPLLAIIALFITKTGRSFIGNFNLKTLTLFHVVRLPVELTLFWLHQHKTVPQIMTFEGRNFDIFCGLTAPVIYYLGYVKASIGKKWIIIWNMICLLLLINIVVLAVLSAPFPFQKFGLGQPNIALFYFPFIWLPCCIVPAALLAHLAVLWRSLKQ